MRLFVKQDLDGFFGLFVDNLVQLLLIVSLCGGLCGMVGDDAAFVTERILPAAAVSILFGNLFYAWQAHRLARREHRQDVTALPYGINTPSLLIYVFFVLAPTFQKTGSAETAWVMGLLACFGSGLIEFVGAFVAEAIRKRTPRAALLSTLASIALGFIAMKFALEIFASPLVAMLPLAIILVTYFSGVRLPLGLPGGLLAVVCGTIVAWCLPDRWLAQPLSVQAVADAWQSIGWHQPQFAGDALHIIGSMPVGEWIGFVSVILPMGLFNIVGSLQNIESAEAGGDAYNTRSSLAVNGVGTLLAAALGSCFPTTIYIGHPGWKQMGARAGYSTLNGLVIALIGLTGAVGLINCIVPIEAGIAIVLWIGLVITAQAFQATPPSHAPAVAIGLFPGIAAWGATVMWGAFSMARSSPGGEHSAATMQSLLETNDAGGGSLAMVNGFLIHGLNLMERGYIFTCMILAATSACLIDGRFRSAAVWAGVGSLFAALGLTHAYQLTGNTVDYLFLLQEHATGASVYRAGTIAAGYALMAIFFLAFGFKRNQPTVAD